MYKLIGYIYKWRWNNTQRQERSGFVSSSVSTSAESNTSNTSHRYPKRRHTPYEHPYGGKGKTDDSRIRKDRSTLQVIHLSNKTLTEAQLSVLGRGLNFPPECKFDCFTGIKDINLFACKLAFKKIFHNKEMDPQLSTPEEQEALMVL